LEYRLKEKPIKFKKVMISVPQELWTSFQEECKKNYKTASGVIRELIINWSKENEKP